MFIGITLVAFLVCALAFAQARKVTNNTKIGVVQVRRAQPGVMKSDGGRDIPWHINYQGYLTDDVGTPINATVNMTFSIWTLSSGGIQMWNEPQTVSVEEGLFNVVLGTSTPIPPAVFDPGESRWLELEVEAQILSPRTEITSVGYAYRAVTADVSWNSWRLENHTLTDLDTIWVNEGQDTSITTAMLVNDAVTSGKILNGTILRADVDAAFKAPYADTADYALAANVGYVDSARVSGNSWMLENNTLADLDTVWVNEGQADAIDSPMILDGGVGTSDLADGSVITLKIQDNAVTSVKIADGAVTNSKVADDAVTSAKILDGTIVRTDAEPAFKAPYADTADYALAASVGYVDSAGVSANSWKLENNTRADLDTVWVNEGQVDAVTSPMILDGSIVRTDAEPAFKAPYADTADYALSAPVAPDGDWTIAGNVLHPSGDYGLTMRSANVLYGTEDSTHVNLGVACTTGTSGQNYQYCTVSGGRNNTASNAWATVGGGRQNNASGGYVTLGGGGWNTASGAYATVGGGEANTANNQHATVGGGNQNRASGARATVSGGNNNNASGFNATVAGGQADTAKAHYGGVLSGYSNLAGDQPEDTAAVVAGGWENSATHKYSFVGGGMSNTASGYFAIVGGGRANTASGFYAAVAGGQSNTASSSYATVGGGYGNVASGDRSAVGGGYGSVASGNVATVAGGYADTVAGDYSFATGRQVRIAAAADYTFAFGRDFTTSTPNAVIFHNSVDTMRVGMGTTSPTATLDVSGSTGYDQIRMRTSYTPTGTADPNGNVGDIAWDDNYIYTKTTAGWKRAALSGW